MSRSRAIAFRPSASITTAGLCSSAWVKACSSQGICGSRSDGDDLFAGNQVINQAGEPFGIGIRQSRHESFGYSCQRLGRNRFADSEVDETGASPAGGFGSQGNCAGQPGRAAQDKHTAEGALVTVGVAFDPHGLDHLRVDQDRHKLAG